MHVVNAVDRMRGYLQRQDRGDLACSVALAIFDARGEPVTVIDGVVGPGMTRSMSFDAARLGVGAGQRAALRASVVFTGPVGERLRCNASTRASLEILPSGGATLGAVLEIPTDWVSGVSPQPF